MKGRREARQKKWQGRRLTHMASVTTLLPAATGSSSINWQDIFHCTITSSRVSAKTAHHRHHNQHPSTHECICLNPQRTYFSAPNYIWNVFCPYHVFFFPPSYWFSPPFERLDPCPCHYAPLSLFCPILQTFTDNYRAQNSSNRNIPLSWPPPAGCQHNKIVLIYAIRPLPWQENDLHQTIKDCQRRQTREERCQHAHTEEPAQLKQCPVNGNT